MGNDPSMCVGVCSWSLQPDDPGALVERVRAVGVHAVQLALDPIRRGAWDLLDTERRLRDAGIDIRSGMMAMRGEDYSSLESIRRTGGVRPHEHWAVNLDAACANAAIAARLAIPLVTFHAGFLPRAPDDPLRGVMIERLRTLVDVFAERGVAVGLETGQETASTLLGVLEELERPVPTAAAVGVNFDPANMILYGLDDPVAAMGRLAPRVAQMHVKDAVATRQSGTWGTEVPVGSGAIDWDALFEAMDGHGLRCDLMIERESGEDRVGDIRAALELVRRRRPRLLDGGRA
jgi:sugar phosphate isomerase/epimerase